MKGNSKYKKVFSDSQQNRELNESLGANEQIGNNLAEIQKK